MRRIKFSVTRPDLVMINEKKKTCCIVDFAISTHHRLKINDSEK